MVNCSVVWNPTSWVGRWSWRSKSLSSLNRWQHVWCCCQHSLAKAIHPTKTHKPHDTRPRHSVYFLIEGGGANLWLESPPPDLLWRWRSCRLHQPWRSLGCCTQHQCREHCHSGNGVLSATGEQLISSKGRKKSKFNNGSKAIHNIHEDMVYFKDVMDFTACKINRHHFPCVYLNVWVMVENSDCSSGGGSDNPVWIQKLQ